MSLSDTLRDILNARARSSPLDLIPTTFTPTNTASNVNQIDEDLPQNQLSTETEYDTTHSHLPELILPQKNRNRTLKIILEDDEEMDIMALNQSTRIWSEYSYDEMENYCLIKHPPIATSTPKKNSIKRPRQEDPVPDCVDFKKLKQETKIMPVALTKANAIIPPEIIKKPKMPGYLRETKASKAKRVPKKPYSKSNPKAN